MYRVDCFNEVKANYKGDQVNLQSGSKFQDETFWALLKYDFKHMDITFCFHGHLS